MQLSLIKPILTNFDPGLIIETLADPSKAVEKVIKNVRNIPCILYTGRGSDEVKRDALESGIDDYIQKILNPNDYRILAKRIRAAVEKYRE